MAHEIPTTGTGDSMPSETPKPVFIYGTLCSLPLLAYVLTGDAKNIAAVTRLAQPARVNDYARTAIQDHDSASIDKHPGSFVDGYVLMLETNSQREILDNFDSDLYYEPSPVTAITDLQADPEIPTKTVEADMYIWAGNPGMVTSLPWSLKAFDEEGTPEWIDTFETMGPVFRNPNQR
ncbi:AIG2-like protein [Xylaria longipes]|nr:AIG2-like protein [Xylaria longipes]